jgi:hypothetical protein
MKITGRSMPYHIKAKNLYDRALLIQGEPVRLKAFCDVASADWKEKLNFRTAIRAFPATPTVSPTVTPTDDPPLPPTTPMEFQDQSIVPCHLFPVTDALHDPHVMTYAEVVGTATTTARRSRVAGQSAMTPSKVKRSKTRVHQNSLAIARDSTKKALAGEIAAKQREAAAEAKADAAVAAAATDKKTYVLLDSTACCAYDPMT